MRGVYTATIKIAALAAAKTLILLTAPATYVLEILSATVTNSNNTTSQQVQVDLAKVTTLGAPVGTAITPAPTETGSAASGTTATGNLTTEPTTYASSNWQEGVNTLVGFEREPVPELRLYVAPSASIGLRLITAPAAFDAECTISWREIG